MGGGEGVSFQGKIEIKIENKAKKKGKFNYLELVKNLS